MSRVSPDRLGQVISHNQQGGQQATGGLPDDSAPAGLAAPAPTTVSAVEMAQDSRQQSAAVSEGVASAGAPAPPQAVVGECTGDAGPQSTALGGFQGETSGAPSSELPGGGSNYGCGENGGASHMDTALLATGSAMLPGASAYGAALRHAAGSAHPAKRKISEVGEVGDSVAAGSGGGGGGGAPMEHDEAPSSWQAAPQAGGSRGTLDRVPSDQGVMLVGGAEGTSPPAAGGGGGEGVQPRDEGDSAAARGPGAQQQQQQAAAALATLAEGTGVRPSDAEILEWEEQIRQQETGSQPLIGDREPLASLAAEYESGSAVFRAKIARLADAYNGIRRARGDGNCFFRSFLFGYLEGLLSRPDAAAERARVLTRLEELKEGMKGAGYDEFVIEPPLDIVLEMLRAVGSPVSPLTLAALESNLREEGVSNYAVFLLRMLTSAEIKRRADFFAPFIMGLSDLDVDTFCARCVDPMGEESDHIQLVALTDALGVPVRVVYLDRSTAPGGGPDDGAAGPADVHVDMHDFVPESCVGQAPAVHVLYRPGHYDILYPTDALAPGPGGGQA